MQSTTSQRAIAGIDVGGKFTHLVGSVDGRLQVHKRLTTPRDQSRAIIEGLRAMGIDAECEVIHGSTVATNALLERRGARTAIITTAGFRDLLEIGRQNRPELYALTQSRK